MKTLTLVATAILSFVTVARAAENVPPPWAFAMDPPEGREPRNRPGDDQPRHVPNSNVTYTRAQTLDLWNVTDWHPDEHPPAPDIVMHGRKPKVFSCGYCHYPNGMGIPENASLAGLPAGYIVQQLKDYSSGARGTAMPNMISFKGMSGMAKEMTDDEMKIAADYFASLKPRPWIKVVETDTVPKTKISNYALIPLPSGETDPVGDRVIEVPADPVLFDLHDSQSGFVAYVPKGSIAKGKKLAATKLNGGEKSCQSCHGNDLRGTKYGPPIAGRGPSNIVRQIYDIQHGANTGDAAQPMKRAIGNLTESDMVALAAYVSSLKP